MATTTTPPTHGAPGWPRYSRWILKGAAAATDLLFPPRCVSCGAECESREGGPLFCPDCDAALSISARTSCPRCALTCSEVDLAHGDCWNCRGRKLLFQEARCIGSYDTAIRAAVLKCKHSFHEPLALALGQRLAESLRAKPLSKVPDLVAAVPIHWLRRLWRGTSTTETLARSVARQLGIRPAIGLLVCRRPLRRQATLTPVERRRNVRGAFRTSRFWNITGRSVLLIADVMTTGATAHEAARALLAAGAASVFVATVARSSPNF